jgi:hypothetical protein
VVEWPDSKTSDTDREVVGLPVRNSSTEELSKAHREFRVNTPSLALSS